MKKPDKLILNSDTSPESYKSLLKTPIADDIIAAFAKLKLKSPPQTPIKGVARPTSLKRAASKSPPQDTLIDLTRPSIKRVARGKAPSRTQGKAPAPKRAASRSPSQNSSSPLPKRPVAPSSSSESSSPSESHQYIRRTE